MSSPGPRVLIVDDEAGIRSFLRASLEAHGYSVNEASTGEEALQVVPAFRPDLILLDLGLPGVGGKHVTSCLREWTQTPIIILSVQADESEKIAALDAGADDYLTKPFGSGELLARIRATIRRVGQQDSGPVFVTGDLSVDLVGRAVRLGEKEVQLTPTEYSLLKAFVVQANKLLTHRQLLREVWGGAHYEDPQHLLRVNINNLRRKLEADPAHPQYIITEPGVGYRLRTEPRASVAPSNVSTILIVDDEAALRQVLRARLTARGYIVHEASTGEDVLRIVPVLRPDVIVLDIGLPDIDGIEVTRRLRPLVQTPIIILSVHATESDKIAALDAGADDYLTKPCDLGELLDRIGTALRGVALQDAQVFTAGDLVVDLNRQMVQVANSPVRLTAMEYDLLKVLVVNAGRLLTQRRLAQEVWGERNEDNALQMLRTTISTLRQKLDSNWSHPGHIATEPGVGYRLRITL